MRSLFITQRNTLQKTLKSFTQNRIVRLLHQQLQSRNRSNKCKNFFDLLKRTRFRNRKQVVWSASKRSRTSFQERARFKYINWHWDIKSSLALYNICPYLFYHKLQTVFLALYKLVINENKLFLLVYPVLTTFYHHFRQAIRRKVVVIFLQYFLLKFFL